ncbi:peptide transporter, putative [Ricinus communis]|uniref:Peptide transporter, putative n=1 Tax=Ricinus communis TaxID=3988 RepID=B9R822_RICCO|nr:peptide transporter, putative [Ricinus communis]|eukprot:XP_002510465.1 protein NRT1/ PTR FAMILY 8.2 [Ricinus communis]
MGEERLSTTLVSNGLRDFKGRIADKETTGRWKASPFIIANEVAEKLAYIAIVVNMVPYFVGEMQQPLPTAVMYVTAWNGAGYVTTIFGAFLADAYIGRFRTILIFSCVYALGLLLLTLSASVNSPRPPCMTEPCQRSTAGQTAFVYGGLALMALGTGGMKPCVPSFGTDQFDEADGNEMQEKFAFFDWLYMSINIGGFISVTVLVYIQSKWGWGWGFGVPTAAMILSIVMLLAGLPYYRFQKPMGSPLTRFVQVLVACLRNHFNGVKVGGESQLYEVQTTESDINGARKLPRTDKYKFLDKAAVVTDPEGNLKNPWRLCTVTQVEEFKSLISVLPLWVIAIAVSISYSQLTTFFVGQAKVMDRKITPNIEIPPGATPVVNAINAFIIIPTYEKLIVPILRSYTGHPRGITLKQRIGVGFFISILALGSAALVEKQRRDSPDPSKVSVLWLFPQFFLLGTSEFFAFVGQLEFFTNEATDGTKSISSAVFLCQFGVANVLSSLLVNFITNASGGEKKGWLRADLNSSKLDYFYWILTTINAISFLLYLWVARYYKSRNNSDAGANRVIEMGDSQSEKREEERPLRL